MQRQSQRERPTDMWSVSPFRSILIGLIPLFIVMLTIMSMHILQFTGCSGEPTPLLTLVLGYSSMVVFCGELILAVVWFLRKQEYLGGGILLLTLLSSLVVVVLLLFTPLVMLSFIWGILPGCPS